MTPLVGTALADAQAASLATDVRHYLTQSPRQLPSRALYDALGSALFASICELPWYPVTRAERRLLAASRDVIFDEAEWPDRLVELGCGNGEKLDLLLGPPDGPVSTRVQRVDLVDVSGSALDAAARLIAQDRAITVTMRQERYELGLAHAAADRRAAEAAERFCVLFLGSNIGNFDPPGARTFLSTIRETLAPGDTLLMGADLVKPEADLLLAYDDPLGVTAAFDKNLLVRLNRELGATFDVTAFDHRAVWNAAASRVEMHLVSRRRQHVDVPGSGLSLDLAAGEIIWTESSYKYTVAGVDDMLTRAGFSPADRWVDLEGQFLLTLARVTS